MELSMLQETNGNTLLHNTTEVNGCDMNSEVHVGTTTEHVAPQTYDPNSHKVIDETTANGSFDTPQLRPKNEDKTLHDPTQISSGPKPGASPPTEHKQHMHLPLRKRHLLASSTGSHHNENLGDNNHVVTTQAPGQAQDIETSLTSTNHTPTEHEPHQANMTIPKPIDPTPTEHADPPDPPEPPETTSNTKHITDSTKVGNGDRNVHTKHEHKDLHESESLAHDISTNTPLNHKRPQFNQSHFNSHQHPQQIAHSLHNLPSQNSYPHHTQPKLPSTHGHSSPTRTNSPTGTQSPTRAVSPGAQTSRHSSSRGRGSGRGRGKTSKVDSLSTASAASSSGGEELYCFCRRPYDPTVDVFMICCDSCDEWYHGSCVGVNQREAKKIARYVCPRCKKMPTSPTTTSATSPEVSSEGEPSTPPTSTKNKKRKNEVSFKTEPKRQALSPPMSDNGVDALLGQEESRYCLNCNKPALPKSKYCGQDCGLEYARKQYHNTGSKKTTSATEIADREALDEIARKKADIAEKLNKLGKEQRDLEKATQFAKKIDSISVSNTRSTSPTVAPDTDELASKNHGPTAENTTIDCISCGHPIARCYHKKENNVLMVGATSDGGALYCNAYDSKTKTFCKKVKNGCTLHAIKRQTNVAGAEGSGLSIAGVSNGSSPTANSSAARRTPPLTCGCPTGDFQSGYCELSRKACVKHHNWEELMRDSISNQRIQHNKILAGLEAEENAVRLRVARRSQAAVSSYRTIEEA